VISLLAYLLKGCTGEPTKSDLADAFREARAFLGMDAREIDHEAAERAKQDRERRRRDSEARAEQDRAARQDSAALIWQDSRPIAGTPAETYLMNRVKHLRMDGWPECLRFHPNLKHDLEGTFHPALVCEVVNGAGEFVGVWRIYITNDGQKAPVENPKLGKGPCGGGHIPLFDPTEDGTIAVCEGVETAFGVWMLDRVPVWPCMSGSGVSGLEIPFSVSRLLIYADGDPFKYQEQHDRWLEPTGARAMAELAERARGEGLAVVTQPVPADGVDYLDLWNSVADEICEVA
jgi:putative DNA primase/helicase